ncbi:MAG: apolipoprotein N-acyltransferase [Candidatus Eisenbacteria bacterium]|uniref:Apolipoprotein N-acyltransferase n=1 Tax=Eiseniibacteriota bacterium TaxID=2212470 RepID=A0A933SCT7_UNCEI|nr:apolipoprotein N-acyltransferase [Candidatus Eisenbacteria bacterium]
MSRSRSDLWLSAASGLALGAAFLPWSGGALAWAAFVPLLFALERRVAAGESLRACFRLGYAGGFAFFLVGTHWIGLLSDVAMTVPVLKYAGWVLSAAYLGLFWGAAAAVAAWLARRSGIAARWTFAVALMLIEWVRGAGDIGFPWFQPGYTQYATSALGLAAAGGVFAVTAWVLLVNACVLGATRDRTPRDFVWLALVLAGGLGAGAWLRGAPIATDGTRPRVALVQGNIPGEEKWSGRHQEEILARFLALSDSAFAAPPEGGATARPVMVVWPETATGSYLRKQLAQSIAVARWASRTGAAVFAGYADYSYDADGKPQPWNAAGIWNPDGRLSPTYAKRHLVPFGERMPFQWLVPALGRVDFGQAEWAQGTGPVVFDGQTGKFSALICFESIFPELARADVNAGSRCLVIVTTDEWFGRSAAVFQHAAMARFRAVENGVPVLRCANTGLTQVIDARGAVVAEAPAFRAAVLTAAVPPPREGRTPYSRTGDWPVAVAAIAAVAIAASRRGVSRSA